MEDLEFINLLNEYYPNSDDADLEVANENLLKLISWIKSVHPTNINLTNPDNGLK